MQDTILQASRASRVPKVPSQLVKPPRARNATLAHSLRPQRCQYARNALPAHIKARMEPPIVTFAALGHTATLVHTPVQSVLCQHLAWEMLARAQRVRRAHSLLGEDLPHVSTALREHTR